MKIVSDDVGLGHCLGAVALVGSRRRQNPTDIQGWRGAQQSIAATASGLPQVQSSLAWPLTGLKEP